MDLQPNKKSDFALFFNLKSTLIHSSLYFSNRTKAVTVLLGVVIMLPFFLASNLHFSLNKGTLIGLLYIGTLPTVGSFIFWNIAVREIGPSQAGIYLYLITVFTAILSILLGKSITIVQIVGGVLVFIGVYLTSKKRTNTVKSKAA